jgi:hypothetical protein
LMVAKRKVNSGSVSAARAGADGKLTRPAINSEKNVLLSIASFPPTARLDHLRRASNRDAMHVESKTTGIQ